MLTFRIGIGQTNTLSGAPPSLGGASFGPASELPYARRSKASGAVSLREIAAGLNGRRGRVVSFPTQPPGNHCLRLIAGGQISIAAALLPCFKHATISAPHGSRPVWLQHAGFPNAPRNIWLRQKELHSPYPPAIEEIPGLAADLVGQRIERRNDRRCARVDRAADSDRTAK
jgi:hypothetical protein